MYAIPLCCYNLHLGAEIFKICIKTFIISSAVQTKETVEIDGVTYPLFKLDTSSESHPFYTGAQTRIVEAGRVEKFRAKYAHVTKSAK